MGTLQRTLRESCVVVVDLVRVICVIESVRNRPVLPALLYRVASQDWDLVFGECMSLLLASTALTGRPVKVKHSQCGNTELCVNV